MNSRRDGHITAALGHKNSLKRDLIIFSMVLGLAVLSGCQSALEDACMELPEVQAELKIKIAGLETFVPASTSKKRSIAATNPNPHIIQIMNAETKLSYMEWAEGLLKRSQWVRDGLETATGEQNRKALATLSDATLNLVSIHGWLEQGKVKKAKRGLEQLSLQYERANRQACGMRKPASK